MSVQALMVDLFRHTGRQGPGGVEQTRLALGLSGVQPSPELAVADVGCGTGASARVLAQALGAPVTAVDREPELIAGLQQEAAAAGLAGRVHGVVASMEALPFEAASLDLLWSEGAIYNMGFERGLRCWRRFLKPAGVLAVSELTWLSRERPGEIHRYWSQAYPDVDTAAGKLRVLEAQGFSPIGYFPLPRQCWLENFYRPLQQQFAPFLSRHGHSQPAQAVVAAEQAEIRLYERYAAFVSYGFYAATLSPSPTGD